MAQSLKITKLKSNILKAECFVCGYIWKTNKRNIKRNKHPCRKCFLEEKRKYLINKDIFLNETDISFYLLGVWYGDGNILKRKYGAYIVSLTSKDKIWLQKIRNLITPNKPLYKQRKLYCLSINSKTLYEWFESWGCIESKSLVLNFPKIPNKYLSHFFRGLFDSDGCITISNNILQTYICSGSKRFITGLYKELIKNKFKFSLLKKTGRRFGKDYVMYRAVTTGYSAYVFLKFLYKDSQVCLNRKYKKALYGFKITEQKMLKNPKRYKGKLL